MSQTKQTQEQINYPWTKKEEALLVDMVNTASQKYAGRINWREMSAIGNHTIASSQTRWSRNLKPLHIWNGKRYVLSSENKLTEVTRAAKRESSKLTPQIKRVKISRSFLWGAIKYERYE